MERRTVLLSGLAGSLALASGAALAQEIRRTPDVIYVPMQTPLLAAARQRGNATVNGLGMLLNQARPAFKAWYGVMPEITPELRAAILATF